MLTLTFTKQALRGFYIHAIVYVPVNTMLFTIDFLTPGGFWFFWPMLGWGIGLGVHAANTFVLGGSTGRGWEERKIRELMDRDR
jgi:hypothetical protein